MVNRIICFKQLNVLVILFTFQWQHEKCSTATFFFGLGFTSRSPCCRKNKQQKRLKKNKKIFCIFEKPRRNKLITVTAFVSE